MQDNILMLEAFIEKENDKKRVRKITEQVKKNLTDHFERIIEELERVKLGRSELKKVKALFVDKRSVKALFKPYCGLRKIKPYDDLPNLRA